MKEKFEKLEELNGRNPFRVPDGYFDNFTEKMMAKLPEREATVAKKISIYDRVRPWLYLAASFVALILLFQVMNKVGKNKETEVIKNGITAITKVPVTDDENSDFMEYIEEMYADKYAYTEFEDLF